MNAVPFLEGAPRVAFVRSSALARLLRDLLLAEGEPSLDGEKVRKALVETVFRPRADVLRQDDVDALINDLWRETGRADGLYNLATTRPRGILADSTFANLEHMGGYYEVRPQRLESHCRLIRDIDPSFLIAVRHIHHLHTGELDVDALVEGLDRQCPLAMPRGNPDWPHADNHVHLYGVGITAHPLAGMLFDRDGLRQEPEIAFDPTLGINGDLDCQALERLFCAATRYMMEFACTGAGTSAMSDDERSELKEGRRPIQAALIRERLSGRASLDIAQHLTLAVARQADIQNAGRALQMLATLALHLHATVSLEERRLHWSVLAYIHSLHLLRSCIVVSGVGLRTFVGYYGNSMRYQGKRFADLDRWRALIGNGTDMVDAKIGHNDVERFRAYAQSTAETAAGISNPLRPAEHGWQRYHLSFHFIRKPGDRKSTPLPMRFSRQRRAVEKTAHELRTMLSKVAWVDSGHTVTSPVRQNLTSWIRSFDIAGDETRVPVEVFAPALRWLRDKPTAQTIRGKSRICPRRAFSIHAGEDFNHIVSGLRHVEETVEFCALGADDRIGHGLALGLDPHEWAQRQGMAIVPLQAHVDNLVWLWHHATLLAYQVEVAARLLPQLHRRLDFFLHALLGHDPPCLETLHRAWKLRRNCPNRLLRDSADANLADTIYWTPDLVEDARIQERLEFAEYRRYIYSPEADAAQVNRVKIWLGRPGPSGLEHGQLVDYVCSDELELITAVQDHLLTIIDAKGIVIEACPTSNLYIGKLQGYEAHPLFRWDPPDSATLHSGNSFNRFGLRNGPVTVCLNTDDPAIMPTTILAEHHLMREAAVRCHGVSRTTAAAWIDRIRANGINLFRRAHRDTDLHQAD